MGDAIEAYIDAQPARLRIRLEAVRAAIRKALPEAEESISYGMPTYMVGGVRVVYFAAWSKHFSLYGATAGVVAAFGDELAGYTVEKGTIQFPYAQPVDLNLIERIVRFRADNVNA